MRFTPSKPGRVLKSFPRKWRWICWWKPLDRQQKQPFAAKGADLEPSQILGGSFLELNWWWWEVGQLFFLVRILVCFLKWSQGNADKKRWGRDLFSPVQGWYFQPFNTCNQEVMSQASCFHGWGGVTYPLFSKEKGPKLRWYSFLYKQTSLSYSKRLPWKIRVNYIELQDCNF